MSSATTEERERPGPRAFVAAILAWVIPGAGHLYLRRTALGVSFCALVLTSLLVGCALDGRLYRVVPGQPLSRPATIACMGMGLPYFVARYAVGYQGDPLAQGFEYGKAFILTAGLMNLLLVLVAWDIGRGAKE